MMKIGVIIEYDEFFKNYQIYNFLNKISYILFKIDFNRLITDDVFDLTDLLYINPSIQLIGAYLDELNDNLSYKLIYEVIEKIIIILSECNAKFIGIKPVFMEHLIRRNNIEEFLRTIMDYGLNLLIVLSNDHDIMLYNRIIENIFYPVYLYLNLSGKQSIRPLVKIITEYFRTIKVINITRYINSSPLPLFCDYSKKFTLNMLRILSIINYNGYIVFDLKSYIKNNKNMLQSDLIKLKEYISSLSIY